MDDFHLVVTAVKWITMAEICRSVNNSVAQGVSDLTPNRCHVHDQVTHRLQYPGCWFDAALSFEGIRSEYLKSCIYKLENTAVCTVLRCRDIRY